MQLYFRVVLSTLKTKYFDIRHPFLEKQKTLKPFYFFQTVKDFQASLMLHLFHYTSLFGANKTKYVHDKRLTGLDKSW